MNEFIKKLIERLEEKIEITWKYNYMGGRKDAFKEAIEIVNQVAEEYSNSEIPNKSDEFCEWFKYDYRTIAPKNHDIDNPYWRIPENMDKLKFCPYCGKEIKVVEL